MNELVILKEFCLNCVNELNCDDYSTQFRQMMKAFGAVCYFLLIHPELEDFVNCWWNHEMRDKFFK